ncbi:MAG TPA: hypothetical protein VKC34_16360 [Blastocatellia bacterium]|nr:hypothetical protein [Blastocatellia bacterium]
MNTEENELKTPAVLGQKYAFATVALVLGIASFVNFLGMEKAILAIIFARLALRPEPAPLLRNRRAWGKAGLILGALQVVIVITVLALNFDRISGLIDALMKLQEGK